MCALPICLVGKLPVGGPPTQPVDHYRIALLLHPLDEFAHPPSRHAHLLSGLALSHAARFNPLQPVQVVSFLLAHRDSFHPSTLWLSRGTFYLAQSGTFYLAATRSPFLRDTTLRCDTIDGLSAQSAMKTVSLLLLFASLPAVCEEIGRAHV